ncbi:hypothetical protein P879_10846 [Paragonimus westermani]|uniref:Secreted protein n=1 Tax=Paragonimus westermani TaxID=34504 RepID=A0A8T0CYM3_9TREM|nr:hypothetical protein P879_10846 [Paragonimus westermani]
MLDVCAQCGWLATSLNCLILMQMLTQGVWFENVGSSLLQLPGIQSTHLGAFRRPDMTPITCLPELTDYLTPNMGRLNGMLNTRSRPNAISELRWVSVFCLFESFRTA